MVVWPGAGYAPSPTATATRSRATAGHQIKCRSLPWRSSRMCRWGGKCRRGSAQGRPRSLVVGAAQAAPYPTVQNLVAASASLSARDHHAGLRQKIISHMREVHCAPCPRPACRVGQIYVDRTTTAYRTIEVVESYEPGVIDTSELLPWLTHRQSQCPEQLID